MDFWYLVLGIAGLLIGTELTIGGALAIARRYRLSDFFVGLIVLSIGSDLPEIAVALDAGMKSLLVQDASGVVVGTTIGSIVALISVVLGVTGLVMFLTLPRSWVLRHGSVLLGATVLLYLAMMDGAMTRAEGLFLIAAYVVYVVVLLTGETLPEELEETMVRETSWPWTRLLIGLLLVTGSSELTVSSVVRIATEFSINEAVISILIVGLGTSLPELSISLGAILKKKVHLSVGNIIGSNIFNTLVPISAAALMSPVLVSPDILNFDLPFAFVLTATVLYLFTREYGLQKWESALLVGVYLLYVTVKLAQL